MVLRREQVAVALKWAKFLQAPDAPNPINDDICKAASLLKVIGLELTQEHIDVAYSMATGDSVPEGLYRVGDVSAVITATLQIYMCDVRRCEWGGVGNELCISACS
jgi:hypothetical protein